MTGRAAARALLALLLATPPAAMTAPASPPALPPCPATPNCVSSEAERADQRMPPLRFTGPAPEALARLRAVVLAMAGTRLVREDAASMHVTFTTRLLRFVDDVHFAVDAGAGVIHFRSASRVGRSDLGTNRRRMEEVARRFAAR